MISYLYPSAKKEIDKIVNFILKLLANIRGFINLLYYFITIRLENVPFKFLKYLSKVASTVPLRFNKAFSITDTALTQHKAYRV